jgi:histone H3/H4
MPKPKKTKKKEVPRLVVDSKVRETIKERADVNVGGDFVDKLTEIVSDHCDEAIRRCTANGRKTLRADDL